jgi:hypothetical protein
MAVVLRVKNNPLDTKRVGHTPTLFVVCTLLLAACGMAGRPVSTPFMAPTMPVPVITPTSAPVAAPPTPLPLCQDNLTYREDLTIPDGTTVAPKTVLDKRWRVENSGTCNWDEHYHLKLTAGSDMGAVQDQALYPARAKSEVILRVQFTAPAEAGTYRSSWQAYDPDGKAFGDPVFIDIIVSK